MPSIANITVKKNDGTTDVTYTAISASAGDGSASIWRDEATTGWPYALRPKFSLAVRENGPKTARRVDVTFKWPVVYQDTTTSLYGSKDTIPFTLSVPIPQGVAPGQINEAVSQFVNLCASTLVKDCMKQAVGAT